MAQERNTSLVTTAAASNEPQTGSSLAMLANLPARLDDTMLATVDSLASLALPALEPTDQVHVAKCIRAAREMLPRRASDDIGGELMIAGYYRKLQHLPKAQVSYAFDKATDRLDWFPTPNQLLDIAAEWNRTDEPVQVKARAEALGRRERNARMDDAFTALRRSEIGSETVNRWPEWWRKVAETRGLVSIDPEGRCRIRESALLPMPEPAGDDEPEVDVAAADMAEVLVRLDEQFESCRA